MRLGHIRVVSIATLVVALVSRGCAQLEVVAYHKDDRRAVSRGSWLALPDLERLEVTGASGELEAWVGKQSFALEQDPHKPVRTLRVDAKLRGAWQQHGSLTLGYATQRNAGGEVTLRASPRRLALPEAGVQLKLAQRRTTTVEHTDGYLSVSLSDIKGAATNLSVHGADGRTLVQATPVRQNDEVEFDLGDERYAVQVERLHNSLFGEDSATIRVISAARRQRDAIDALLQHIATAEVKFVREGSPYTGAEAAVHLRRKYDAVRDQVRDVETFISAIGSRSSTSGKPYSIELADGTAVPAEQWLREQAAALAKTKSAR